MGFDVLILNSGEWVLAEELPAEPWHILIYRQRLEKRNELHVWLPRRDTRGSGEYAFLRYWVEGRTRWRVEAPRDPDRPRGLNAPQGASMRLRFTAPDGLVVWAVSSGQKRLGDFTDRELQELRQRATVGPYSRI
ncbi:MAG TPA: hypothetical protein VMN39_00855 [Longimicrobiaceae bacterium]|nr:hypothetical protein [Longimicrobiaceae bacterium]